MARPKGSLTKNKQHLLKRLQDMYGEDFHPIMNIAQNCVELQQAAQDALDCDRESKLKAANAEWSRIAEYTEPKLKAVEHSVDEDTAQRFISADPTDNEDAFKRKHGVESAEGSTTRTD